MTHVRHARLEVRSGIDEFVTCGELGILQHGAFHARVHEIAATARWVAVLVRILVLLARRATHSPTFSESVRLRVQHAVAHREVVRLIAVEISAESAGFIAVAFRDVHFRVAVSVPDHLDAYAREHSHEVAVLGDVQVRRLEVRQADPLAVHFDA